MTPSSLKGRKGIVIPWDGGPRYWIVESKALHRDLGKALRKAQGYSKKVNDLENGAARFATGIAGTPEQSFYVRTIYWNGEAWQEVAINNYETTGFLSPEQCQIILDDNTHKITLFDDDPERFLRKANDINKTLHNNEIPVADRAKIMAALLLALAQDGNLRIHNTPIRLMREINGLIEDLLHQHGKEDFTEVIKLTLPATEKNHKKYRKAIIEALQHLREMNIRSAINSGDDALGKFYETFLKYANGAKEMGIVLTPRHITRFAVDVLGIGPRDRVFDPACGTGGFLISAMESIRSRNTKNYEQFRNDNLFGIEQRDDVYGLAIVNMIFRGDGKSRIYDGNCFDHEFWFRDGAIWYTMPKDDRPEGGRKPFSRVLMNPPFKLTNSPETTFVDYGLRQARRGALLFAVLPAVVMGGATYEMWRRELMERHTVLACIKFEKSLFYPVTEATYGLIVRAHKPHKSSDPVFMGSLFDDNHRPRKSKMISDHKAVDNVDRLTKEARNFLLGKPVDEAVPREQCVITINQDLGCCFSPENYLPSGSGKPVSAALRHIESEASRMRSLALRNPIASVQQSGTFNLVEHVVERIETAPLKTLKEWRSGSVPVVSATGKNNGVAEWLDIPEELCLNHCITISIIHNTRPCEAFWHPYRFSALVGKALVLRPIEDLLRSPDAILYLCEAITSQNSWRYHYARSVRLHELGVDVPIGDDGRPSIKTMARIVRKQLS